MRQLLKYFIPGLALLMFACNSSDEKSVDVGLKYFPLSIGNSWIYNVKEIIYDTLIQKKNLNYQEKYEIVDTVLNQWNENTYVLYISKRNDDNSPWIYSETWSTKISSFNEIIVNEGNIAYLKILLPIANGLTWKGNKYNTVESTRNNGRIDNFVITDFKKPFGDYNKTFKVEESNDVNFSYKDLRYAIYAEGVGLVYRINNYVDYCDENDCFGLGLRKHEVTKILTLLEYEIQ